MKYQIKYLNTPTITINQKQLKTGDWFADDAVINWEKDTQAMRVVSQNNKVYTLSAKRYRESKSKKFSDFIAVTKPMATRGLHTLQKDLQAIFENEYEILDELLIDLSPVKNLPPSLTIIITSPSEDEDFHLTLQTENGALLIPRDSLPLTPEVPLTVEALLPSSPVPQLITTWFTLLPLPLQPHNY